MAKSHKQLVERRVLNERVTLVLLVKHVLNGQ